MQCTHLQKNGHTAFACSSLLMLVMHRFFVKLSADDAVKQQQQQLALSAASIEARAVAVAQLRRGVGRPKRVLNADTVLAAAAAAHPVEKSGSADSEPLQKRGKYRNWSGSACFCSLMLADLQLTNRCGDFLVQVRIRSHPRHSCRIPAELPQREAYCRIPAAKVSAAPYGEQCAVRRSVGIDRAQLARCGRQAAAKVCRDRCSRQKRCPRRWAPKLAGWT